MKFADKLDRITARAEELRAALGEVLGGEAYVRASKELAELEPIVARVSELRAAEQALDEAEAMLADPEMPARTDPWFTA
jgi:peptide chain release factor 1